MPAATTPPSSTDKRRVEAFFLLLAAILVFAPLFRSGKAPLAQLVLELLAVSLIGLLLWTPDRLRARAAEVAALASLFLLPLLFLVPLPATLIDWLPGRQVYAEIQAQIGAGADAAFDRISLLPFVTESAWLLTLVPIAIFLGVRHLDYKTLRRLVLLLFGIAAFQAALGLMQYGGQSDLLYLGMEGADGNAVGTYTNRNHLAALLAMSLPIVLALLVYSIGRGRHERRTHWRKQVAFISSIRGHAALGYAALALLLLLGIVFTRSRAGIALAMLGILFATLAFSRRIGGTNVYGLIGTLIAFAVGIAIVIGLAPVLDRFSVSGTIENARWTIYSTSLTGIGAFFPVGSGPGNYPDVFSLFQPLELGQWFINHAHNDYLEWLFEAGAFAAVLIVLFLLLYLGQWRTVWASQTEWSQLRFIQVGAGIGIFLMLLHSLVEYNLHTPANIVYFAFLCGLFFADSSLDDSASRSRRRSSGRKAAPPAGPAPSPPSPAPRIPDDQIKNPFLD